MEMPINLLLIGLFFTKALALECYHCWPPGPGVCTDTIQCKDVCGSLTTEMTTNLMQQKQNIKACMQSSLCNNFSMDTGSLKQKINGKCCATDRCNTEDVPVLPSQPPNGMKCCSQPDCLLTVECHGDEDRCINGYATQTGYIMLWSGCATKNMCGELTLPDSAHPLKYGAKCCEGNLCNSAGSTTQSLLLVLGPLLSSSLFISALW
ncbi:uncharacterized protein LOC143485208 [Brachyhypopomus gauderio]|uniref:uncharacterized protein LOC143485208 n=1 Tax=Brachyhypopomus gauderio TaxID=698409 RepID=UPI0040425918